MLLLRHDYCPGCLRGGGSSLAPRDDPRIDRLQALHAQRTNQLRLLDLSRPGAFCANERVCQIRCLVCGSAVVMGHEGEFEEAARCMRGRDWPAARALAEEIGARFAEGWNRLVHTCCGVRAPVCGCFIPRQLHGSCPLHTKGVNKTKTIVQKKAMQAKKPDWSGVMCKLQPAPPCQAPAKKAPAKKAIAKKPIVAKKPIAKSEEREDFGSRRPRWAGRGVRDDGSAAGGAWEQPAKRRWLSHEEWAEKKRAEQVDLDGGFDERRHGYYRINGELCYKHKNGQTYRATGVDQFD
jgi:hypothetical protein